MYFRMRTLHPAVTWLIRCSLVLAVGLSFSVSGLSAKSSPVIFANDTLFVLHHHVGSFTTEQRARIVTNNVAELAELPLVEYDSLRVEAAESGHLVYYRDRVINSVTEADAESEGLSTAELAERNRAVIRSALVAEYERTSTLTILTDIGLFIAFSVGLVLMFAGINRGFNFLRFHLRHGMRRFVESRKDAQSQRVLKLIGPGTQAALALGLLRVLRVTTLLLLLYLYLPFLFSQLAYTRGFGERLLVYVLNPVHYVWASVIDFVPKLLFIMVIVWAASQLLKVVNFIANKVQRDELHFEGFYSDWAKPTANLVRGLICVFTLVVIFPYLPGAGSDAFQGISVFVGLLLSLGSAGAISNAVSGVILTYMRPFQVGHRVKINDVTGDVIGKNLLVTRLRTTKNEEVTIPNAALLGGGIVNFTSLAETQGVIVHSSVTIGYDVPWPQVHELLVEAARRTAAIAKTPEPFVLQKALQDWYVEYELNAFTKDSHAMPRTYSELHGHMQDVFRDANVEIMSPHYMAHRTAEESTVPKPFEVVSLKQALTGKA